LLLSHFIDEPIILALLFLLSLRLGSLLPLTFCLRNALACYTKSVFLANVALSADEMSVDAVIIDQFDAERCVVSTESLSVATTFTLVNATPHELPARLLAEILSLCYDRVFRRQVAAGSIKVAAGSIM
jgi:hypothetical protein